MGTGPPTDSSLEADPPGPLTEKRELQRTAVRYGVRVRFRRGEQEETVHGRIRDISNRGVCINADVEFTKGTLLFLDVPQLRLTGCGKVRHCAPRLWGFGGYSIGIQLNGPLYRSL